MEICRVFKGHGAQSIIKNRTLDRVFPIILIFSFISSRHHLYYFGLALDNTAEFSPSGRNPGATCPSIASTLV